MTVAATYRPQKGDIAVFVDDGKGFSSATVLSVLEARVIHGVLGAALKLADCAKEPLKAVEGARP
jgi:hypothetical protein